MKRLLCAVLSLGFFVAAAFCVPFAASAQEYKGTQIKKSTTYYYYETADKTLYINGYGDIPNLSNSTASIPWLEWDDSKIQRVVVAEGITALGNYVFYGVQAKEFVLPTTLKKIGTYSLSGTNGMTEWTLPFGIESIESNAFYNCVNMKSITLPKSVKTIGDRAFGLCTSLKSIVIPSSVEKVGSNAFYRCTSLESVEFASPTQKTAVGTKAFWGCSSLLGVTLPSNASCDIMSFGYNISNKVIDGFSLKVYSETQPYYYAQNNGILYSLLTKYDLNECVENPNTITSDIVNDTLHYTFTPKTNQRYSIYSSGACDLKAQLYLDGKLIAESDDIDKSNSGFCFDEIMQQGKEYDIYVSSVKMTGDYSIFVYPSEVSALSVYRGSLTVSAADSKQNGTKRIFTISDDMLGDFILTVSFADGQSEEVYYSRYIAGDYVKNADDQSEKPFSCGENEAHLSLKGCAASYPFTVEHSYVGEVIEPTVDDDGYTLYTCVNCDNSYKTDYVETTSYKVTGRFVFDEDSYGSHDNNVPYSQAYITVEGRRYDVNSDGTWCVRTFSNCYATVHNEYGEDARLYLSVDDKGNYDYGNIALKAYDMNGDGVVNAKDYLIYYYEKRDTLGDDYWQFGNNYLLRRKS